ncbi:MAG: hypothetical protein K2X06_02035 [Burkholderiales bacterium]|nr:hypothetical protein [Burkholderiales bacterium]
MAGPSVLLKVAGASGLLCFWLARRGRSRRGYPVTSLWDTAVTSARGLMLALILRYGRTRLGAIFR